MAAQTASRARADVPRVVIGINTFGPLEGAEEQQVPQHSAEFRSNLKLEMLVRKAGGAEGFARMLIDMKRKRGARSSSRPPDEACDPATRKALDGKVDAMPVPLGVIGSSAGNVAESA
jgi:hypothetical protein